jgi:hypothetical protein
MGVPAQLAMCDDDPIARCRGWEADPQIAERAAQRPERLVFRVIGPEREGDLLTPERRMAVQQEIDQETLCARTQRQATGTWAGFDLERVEQL